MSQPPTPSVAREAQKLDDHLAEWQRRHELDKRAAIEVHRLREITTWQLGAAQALERVAPGEVNRPIAQGLGRDFASVRAEFPLPLDRTPRISLSTSTSTGLVSSQLAIFSALSDLTSNAETLTPLLRDYQQLADRQRRLDTTRARLHSCFPDLLDLLDAAERSYRLATLELDAAASASVMRTFIQKLKGEMFDRARRIPGENMTWTRMSERLCAGPTAGVNQQASILLEQEVQHAALVGSLSEKLKLRRALKVGELDALWVRTLDHCYVVCGCLLPPDWEPSPGAGAFTLA